MNVIGLPVPEAERYVNRRQLATLMGVSVATVAAELYRLRTLGFEIPAANYNNAKLAESRGFSPEAVVLGRSLAERGITPASFALGQEEA
jgi:hypothetical protein